MSIDSSYYQEPVRVSEIADDMYTDVVKQEDAFDLSGFIGSLPKGVFEKAQALGGGDLARIFLDLLYKQLTDEERGRLARNMAERFPKQAATVDIKQSIA